MESSTGGKPIKKWTVQANQSNCNGEMGDMRH